MTVVNEFISDIISENTSQSSLDFCDDKTRKDLNSCSASMHELFSDVLTEELENTYTPSHSREQETEDSNIKENMHRDDLLEGAENINEIVVSEFLESDDASTCSLSTRVLPEVSTEMEGEDLAMSLASMTVSDAVSKSSSQSQKRSVAVRDLSKGIYVTNTASAGKNLRTGATNEADTLKPLEMGASQETREGQKKRTLQQFPLLQSLLSSGLRTNTQSQKF